MIRDVVEEDDRSDEEEEGDDNETIHLGNNIIASDPKDLEGDTLGDGWDMDDSRQHLPEPQVSLMPTQTGSMTASSFPAHHPPTPEIAASASASLTTDNQPFTLDGPATCIRQKPKARDLQAILEVCTCGQAMTDNKISSSGHVIKCKSTGCETGWVSQIFLENKPTDY